jgi:hypothetical protein
MVWVSHSHGSEKLHDWVTSDDGLVLFSSIIGVQGDQVIWDDD